jgi:hypothetical protein
VIPPGIPRRPSFRRLALIVIGVNLGLCAVIVAVLLAAREPDPEQLATPAQFTQVTEPTSTFAEPPATVPAETYSTPETATLDEYRHVTGPGGMTTLIPSTWPTSPSTGPGAMQADDPTGTTVYLRYGGSPSPVTDAYDTHVEYERQVAASKDGYTPLRLERTTVRGMSAVDWEFQHDAPDGRRHVRSLYWLARGNEYFVLASAPVELWPETQTVLDVMLSNATP